MKTVKNVYGHLETKYNIKGITVCYNKIYLWIRLFKYFCFT